MHGLPRKAPTPEEAAASAAKASKLRLLQSEVLHNHRHNIYTKEALDASLKLLDINPEVLYGWNYRKIALQHHLKETTDDEAIKSLVDEELRVVEIALRKNPKSYGAWHHRKWVLRLGLVTVNFDREFGLIQKLLAVDPRNFHGWNYRRFVAALKDVPKEEELQFTKKMIDNNFSNYSAWHQRSVLLSQLLQQKAQGFVSRENVLTEEYELVREALFTDSEDQSGWFYHLWLLDQIVTPDLLIISSWPVNGSDLQLSHGNTSSHTLLPLTTSSQCPSPNLGTIPIILFFNQAVKCVNSSTVEVNSKFLENRDLIWMPLSSASSGEACCWVTHLKLPDIKSGSSEVYPVEVRVGYSEGIISSSGSHYSRPLQFRFSLELHYYGAAKSEQESVLDLFVWNTDSLYQPEEGSIISFDQLMIMENNVPEPSKWNLETLSNQITDFKDLLEENCKFAMLTLTRLYNAYDVVSSHGTLPTKNKTQSGEILKFLDDLIQLDPLHRRYYEDERSLVLLEQVTSDKGSLMKRCWHHDKLISSPFQNHACLRLNNLALTRIGFAERLLWVQTLDLSHNMIRSVEGLEALQLLTCLNLSHNRIGNFTALEPLKLLASLKILNISFNEIGAHPVDTTRYLCLSSLSHTKGVERNFRECEMDTIKIADNWEAIFLFRELRLTQLDIKGNIVSGDSLRLLLSKVAPTLKWLDGESLR